MKLDNIKYYVHHEHFNGPYLIWKSYGMMKQKKWNLVRKDKKIMVGWKIMMKRIKTPYFNGGNDESK